MLILKYISAVIALFCTILYINVVISDIVFPPSLKALQMNISENDVIKSSSTIKIVLNIIMAITWPILFIF